MDNAVIKGIRVGRDDNIILEMVIKPKAGHHFSLRDKLYLVWSFIGLVKPL